MNEEEREKLQKSFGMHAIIEGKKYTMYIIEDDQRDCGRPGDALGDRVRE